MKINISIDTEEKSMARALFNIYVDVKKKELTKIQINDIITKIDCDCGKDTSYKITTIK